MVMEPTVSVILDDRGAMTIRWCETMGSAETAEETAAFIKSRLWMTFYMGKLEGTATP